MNCSAQARCYKKCLLSLTCVTFFSGETVSGILAVDYEMRKEDSLSGSVISIGRLSYLLHLREEIRSSISLLCFEIFTIRLVLNRTKK
jgi:hypothetical protein